MVSNVRHREHANWLTLFFQVQNARDAINCNTQSTTFQLIVATTCEVWCYRKVYVALLCVIWRLCLSLNSFCFPDLAKSRAATAFLKYMQNCRGSINGFPLISQFEQRTRVGVSSFVRLLLSSALSHVASCLEVGIYDVTVVAAQKTHTRQNNSSVIPTPMEGLAFPLYFAMEEFVSFCKGFGPENGETQTLEFGLGIGRFCLDLPHFKNYLQNYDNHRHN